MNTTQSLINTASVSGKFELIIGAAEQDLFTRTSSTGDRTILGTDGHHYTSVDCYEGFHACSPACLAKLIVASIGEPTVIDAGAKLSDVNGSHAYDADFTMTFLAENSSGGWVDATVHGWTEHNADTESGDICCASCGTLMAGTPSDEYVTAAVEGYLVAALWSTVDDSRADEETGNGPMLDENYSPDDISADVVEAVTDEVRSFLVANWSDLHNLDAEQVGHDFLLTRDGHGAGFWDRGLGDRGDRLSDACRPYGESNFYVADNGTISNA